MTNRSMKDARIRACVHAYEMERTMYKAVCADMSLPTPVRRAAMLKLAHLPRESSPTRVVNRCVVSGRSRGVLRRFQLSRLCVREAAAMGILPGVFKASW